LRRFSADGEHWDAILDFDVLLWLAQSELQSQGAWGKVGHPSQEDTPHAFWNEYIDEPLRAYLLVHRAVPLERILALDPLGDGPYPVPHVLVDFADTAGPFLPRTYMELALLHGMGTIDAAAETRVDIFPKPIPGVDEPPPVAFDDTASDAPALPKDAAKRLAALLPAADLRSGKDDENDEIEIEPSREHESTDRSNAFQHWCATVARPAFSSLAVALRAAGHSARVVVRPPSGVGWAASIEIRIKPRSTRYLPDGHVRVSCLAYMPDWRLEVSPNARETPARYGTSPHPTVTTTTSAADLHGLVFAALERMTATG
jgi:hypothetical protein